MARLNSNVLLNIKRSKEEVSVTSEIDILCDEIGDLNLGETNCII